MLCRLRYSDTSQFLVIVRNYTKITELTPEIMRKLIEKIVVHAPDESNGHRVTCLVFLQSQLFHKKYCNPISLKRIAVLFLLMFFTAREIRPIYKVAGKIFQK
ncbi:MAG: DUF4368 domain-containing protein [Oscillospiraceae bacterium]|nr:DUF4368 domain-containing protein [Oscillospiraceae bacterium]